MWDAMITQDCIYVNYDINVTLPGASNSTFYWAGTYLDPTNDAQVLAQMPLDAKKNECSIAPPLAAIYFCTYMLVVVYLMVQLVIGIILENIELHSRIENMPITQQHIQAFVNIWEELDKDGCGFIDAMSFTALLVAVDPPMGVRGSANLSLR